MELLIDGTNIKSEKDLHDFFSRTLNLPSWYGGNLDALWDVLTGMIERPLTIVWLNAKQSEENLANYEKIISLLKEVKAFDEQIGRSSLRLEIR